MADQFVTISRDLLRDVIATNEVGDPANAYLLSHAGTSKSGFSVGAFQLDLAHQPGARTTVEDFLAQSDAFTSADLDTIKQGFLTTGNPDAIAADLKAAVNAQFATAEGHAMINGLDTGQLNDLMGFIDNACGDARANRRYAAEEAFRAFSDSDLFQALMGDNANQYGPPNTFGRYIEGQPVTVGGETVELGDNPWNFETFASYEARYSYVRSSEQGAHDMRRRRTNIINVLAAHDALGDVNQDDCLTIIQTVYQATG